MRIHISLRCSGKNVHIIVRSGAWGLIIVSVRKKIVGLLLVFSPVENVVHCSVNDYSGIVKSEMKKTVILKV